MGGLRLPVAPLFGLRFLRPPIPWRCRSFLRVLSDSTSRSHSTLVSAGQELFDGSPFPFLFQPWKQSGSPRFLGSLHFRSATLLDPGRASLPGPLRQFRTAPDKTTTKAPSTLAFSRLSHAASRLAVYASSPSLPPAGKTRFRLVASLYRVGFLHPQGSSRKFPVQHVNSCHPFLLLQAYPGATPLRFCVENPLPSDCYPKNDRGKTP